MLRDPQVATLEELETHWSILDVLQAHDGLAAIDDARAHQAAQQQRERE